MFILSTQANYKACNLFCCQLYLKSYIAPWLYITLIWHQTIKLVKKNTVCILDGETHGLYAYSQRIVLTFHLIDKANE